MVSEVTMLRWRRRAGRRLPEHLFLSALYVRGLAPRIWTLRDLPADRSRPLANKYGVLYGGYQPLPVEDRRLLKRAAKRRERVAAKFPAGVKRLPLWKFAARPEYFPETGFAYCGQDDALSLWGQQLQTQEDRAARGNVEVAAKEVAVWMRERGVEFSELTVTWLADVMRLHAIRPGYAQPFVAGLLKNLQARRGA